MDPSLQYLELLASGEVKNRFISKAQAQQMLDEERNAAHQKRLTQSRKSEH